MQAAGTGTERIQENFHALELRRDGLRIDYGHLADVFVHGFFHLVGIKRGKTRHQRDEHHQHNRAKGDGHALGEIQPLCPARKGQALHVLSLPFAPSTPAIRCCSRYSEGVTPVFFLKARAK